jgi:hypothetical protein
VLLSAIRISGMALRREEAGPRLRQDEEEVR